MRFAPWCCIAWYNVDIRNMPIIVAVKITAATISIFADRWPPRIPVVLRLSSTRPAVAASTPMPWIMELAISSPIVYSGIIAAMEDLFIVFTYIETP